MDAATKNSEETVAQRPLIALAVVWFCGLAAYLVLRADVVNSIWIGAMAFDLGLPAVGVILLAYVLVAYKHAARQALLSAAMIAMGLLIFFTVGFDLGHQVRFQISRSHYEARAAEIMNTNDSAVGMLDDCVVDVGPPQRIAFYWVRGVVDNWVGLVYDPSDSMVVGDVPIQGSSAVRGLFGGDVTRIKKLAPKWYMLWFT